MKIMGIKNQGWTLAAVGLVAAAGAVFAVLPSDSHRAPAPAASVDYQAQLATAHTWGDAAGYDIYSRHVAAGMSPVSALPTEADCQHEWDHTYSATGATTTTSMHDVFMDVCQTDQTHTLMYGD